jgi:large subunit ribosomal protein L37Ae
MERTKKVRAAGKFGVRYGRKIRERFIEVEKTQRKRHACPSCLKKTVKRVSKGIWQCNKCGLKFAGKAYKP